MIVLLVPCDSCHFQSLDIIDVISTLTPRILEWSSPCFGEDGSHDEVVSESILENTAIDLIIFVNGFYVIAQCWSELVFVEHDGVFDEETEGEFIEISCGCCVCYSWFVDVGHCYQHVWSYLVELLQGKGEAWEMLPVVALGIGYLWFYGVALESWVFWNWVGKQKTFWTGSC